MGYLYIYKVYRTKAEEIKWAAAASHTLFLRRKSVGLVAVEASPTAWTTTTTTTTLEVVTEVVTTIIITITMVDTTTVGITTTVDITTEVGTMMEAAMEVMAMVAAMEVAMVVVMAAVVETENASRLVPIQLQESRLYFSLADFELFFSSFPKRH